MPYKPNPEARGVSPKTDREGAAEDTHRHECGEPAAESLEEGSVPRPLHQQDAPGEDRLRSLPCEKRRVDLDTLLVYVGRREDSMPSHKYDVRRNGLVDNDGAVRADDQPQ